jgi:hypothetical protein
MVALIQLCGILTTRPMTDFNDKVNEWLQKFDPCPMMINEQYLMTGLDLEIDTMSRSDIVQNIHQLSDIFSESTHVLAQLWMKSYDIFQKNSRTNPLWEPEGGVEWFYRDGSHILVRTMGRHQILEEEIRLKGLFETLLKAH